MAQYTGGMDAPEKRRWYCPTPGWLVFGSMVVTGLLFLSNHFGWPAWHKGYAVLVSVAGVGVVLMAMLLWWLVALVFRWRFQFSVRTLLVLAVAVALPFSWLGTEMKEAHKQRDAVASLRGAGLQIYYDIDLDKDGRNKPGNDSPCLAFVRRIFGADLIATPVTISAPTSWIAGFGGIHSVCDTLIGDAHAQEMCALVHLRDVDLSGSKITDAGLASLQGLPEIEDLSLSDTAITDRGLAALKTMHCLRRLNLNFTGITRNGLPQLYEMKHLRRLSVVASNATSYSQSDVEELTHAIPDCDVSVFFFDRH